MFLKQDVWKHELPTGWLWLLGVGLFIQMVGGLFIVDGSRQATWQYLSLFLPALVLLTLRSLSAELWRQPTGLLLLALMGWVLLSGVFRGAPEQSQAYWFKVVLLGLLYVFAVALIARTPRFLFGLLITSMMVAGLFAWLSLYYQFVVLDRPVTYRGIREVRIIELGWGGLADLKNAVVAGIYFGIFLVMAVYFFLASRFHPAWLALIAFIGFGLTAYVFVAFSRGAWFAALAASLAILLLHPGRRSQILLGMGAVALLCALWFFWPELQVETRRGLSGRDAIWQVWFERLSEFWLFGSGAGSRFLVSVRQGITQQHAHSFYLQFWFEYGLIGLLLLLGLLAALLWKGWQCRQQPLARLGLALLVYAMVAMLTDVDAIISRPSEWWTLFWVPVGILLGIPRQASSRTAPVKAS